MHTIKMDPKFKKTDNIKCWQVLFIISLSEKVYIDFGRIVWHFIIKLNIDLPHSVAVMLLDI